MIFCRGWDDFAEYLGREGRELLRGLRDAGAQKLYHHHNLLDDKAFTRTQDPILL